jgi:hypothetical protein
MLQYLRWPALLGMEDSFALLLRYSSSSDWQLPISSGSVFRLLEAKEMRCRPEGKG